MNAKGHAASSEPTPPIWRRLAVVLILAAPFLFASGGFLLLPPSASQHLASWLQPLSSVLIGFVAVTVWQCAVFFGWFLVLCFYLYGVDISFRRTSLFLAVATVFVALLCATFLLHQQQRIAIATADAYFD
jgi:hypothetical protein